jgi:hypothetical protein
MADSRHIENEFFAATIDAVPNEIPRETPAKAVSFDEWERKTSVGFTRLRRSGGPSRLQKIDDTETGLDGVVRLKPLGQLAKNPWHVARGANKDRNETALEAGRADRELDLTLDPLRGNRLRREQDDHCIGFGQRLPHDERVVVAGSQASGVPRLQPTPSKGFREGGGKRLVFGNMANEDIHGRNIDRTPGRDKAGLAEMKRLARSNSRL